MIPLSVVNQGSFSEEIIIDASTENGLVLAEWYKLKKGKYPNSNTITFTINSNVTIISKNTSTPAIVEGSNWPTSSKIIINNKGTVLGRGGDGGTGAIYYPTPSNNFTLIAAKPGTNGGVAIGVDRTTCVVNNTGTICGGGGGGGGGSSWTYDDGTWAGWRNGTVSGGGAPLGKSSTPVGSAPWLLEIQPTWQAKIDSAINQLANNPPSGIDGNIYRRPPVLLIFNGHLSKGSVRTIVNISNAMNYHVSIVIPGISPLTGSTGRDGVIFPYYTRTSIFGPPPPPDMYYSWCSEGELGEPAALSYIPAPATTTTSGKGGCTIGCSFDGHATSLMLRDYGQFPLAYKYGSFDNDLVGGTGGNWGNNGTPGATNHYLLTNYRPWQKQTYKKTMPKDIFVGKLKTAPLGAVGLAGYVKTGNVTIINKSGGITKGR